MRESLNLPGLNRIVQATLTLLLTGFSAGMADPGEARPSPLPCAVWVVRNALESPAAWGRAMDAVERVGCSRIYIQVSGRWDAYYASGVFRPPARDPRAEGWEDPVARAVADAHARGLEVHAWVNALLAWSAPEPPQDPAHVFRRHPDWFLSDAEGRSMRSLGRAELDRAGLTGEGWFLDPARSEVRTELRRFVLELALRYPVEGIHLDYIRYPAGWAPPDGTATIAHLVGLIRDDLARIRPAVSLSAAVLPVPAEARRSFGQAWDEWLASGIVDEVLPMVYRSSAEAINQVVEGYPSPVPRERLWIGVRLDHLDPAEVRRAAATLAEAGVAGVALFSHNLLLEDPAWQDAGRLALVGDLFDLVGPDAAGADPHPADRAVDARADRLQVGEEPATALVVGVADPVAMARSLAADVTDLGHGRLDPVP